jgi:hypothetical protein
MTIASLVTPIEIPFSDTESPHLRITAVAWSSMLGMPAADAGFIRRDDSYLTQAALDGVEPRLRIHNAAALGGLRLRSA